MSCDDVWCEGIAKGRASPTQAEVHELNNLVTALFVCIECLKPLVERGKAKGSLKDLEETAQRAAVILAEIQARGEGGTGRFPL